MSPITNFMSHIIVRQSPPTPTGPEAPASSGTTFSSAPFVEVTVPIIGAVIVLILIGFCVRTTSVRRTAAYPVPYGANQFLLAPVDVRRVHDVNGSPIQRLSNTPGPFEEIAERPPAYTPREKEKVEGTSAAAMTSIVAAAAGL